MAYFDGELPPEEQAEAEKLMDSDPRWRKLLGEFSSLQTHLGELESHALEENFSEIVLRQAEQSMLGESPQGDSKTEAPQTDGAQTDSAEEEVSDQPRFHLDELPLSTSPRAGFFHLKSTSRRVAAGSITAAAAALLVMLFNPWTSPDESFSVSDAGSESFPQPAMDSADSLDMDESANADNFMAAPASTRDVYEANAGDELAPHNSAFAGKKSNNKFADNETIADAEAVSEEATISDSLADDDLG
ncbi:MAG: hypothetical protein N2C14_01735, partial [Planctomycetales bacterium]